MVNLQFEVIQANGTGCQHPILDYFTTQTALSSKINLRLPRNYEEKILQ
jgi:hypothetical protein